MQTTQLRTGFKEYRGQQIPILAKVFTIQSGQECRLISTFKDGYEYKCSIYVFDTNEIKIVPYGKVEKYL
jgi:hypothetical protein